MKTLMPVLHWSTVQSLFGPLALPFYINPKPSNCVLGDKRKATKK